MKPGPIPPGIWMVLLLGLGLFGPLPRLAAQRCHPSRLIIKPLKERKIALETFRRQLGHRTVRRLGPTDIEVVDLPQATDITDALARYRRSGLCEFAEPDYRVWPATAPNDPRYQDGSLWHLNNTGQSGGQPDADLDGPEAWDTLATAPSVIVAVIDTGVRYTHEDLAANMWVNPGEIPNNGIDDDQSGYIDDIHGINAANRTGDPIDLDGHGTEVAGLIGARGNNGRGLTGVAWEVQIMAGRFYDDTGMGYVSDAVTAIHYARRQGARIINASFIVTDFSASLYSALDQCRAAGMVVVAAAGNDTADTDATPYYPGGYDLNNVVTVVATTRRDQLSGFSNYGALTTDLAAPGSSIYTTLSLNDSAYGLNSGTSFSAPIVAGAFALLYARFPEETYLQLIERAYAAVDPLPALQGRCRTGGRLNLARALGPSISANFTIGRSAGLVPFPVSFTNTSFGIVTNFLWDFGDGTVSTEIAPQHTYLHPGEYTASLQVTGADGLTSRHTRVLSALAGYTVSEATYEWLAPTNPAIVSLGSSGVSQPLTLPFQFLFYGRLYEQIYVGADGLIGFEALSLPPNSTLPSEAAPNNIICPFWDDLRPGTAGTVLYGTSGIAPHRHAVVSWVGVRHAAFPWAEYTFQAVLSESSGQISFQYQTVEHAGANPGREGRLASVGLEHASGQVAQLYSHNGTALLRDRQAITFMPVSQVLRLEIAGAAEAFALRLLGRPLQSYVLESSSNLIDWTDHSIHSTDEGGAALIVEPFAEPGTGLMVFRARPAAP